MPSHSVLIRRSLAALGLSVAAGTACRFPGAISPQDVVPLPSIVAPTVRVATPEPSSPPAPAATDAALLAPSAVPAFRDDFDGVLDSGWSWLREDPSAWSLTLTPGWLRLTVSTGRFLGEPPSNVLLRPAPPGDFDLRAGVRFSPSRNFESAGLLVYFDDNTLLQFGHGFCDLPGVCAGDGYYFDNLQAGAPVGGNFATSGVGGAEDQLRLVRQGNTYSAYYLVDDTTWIEIGSHVVDRAPVSFGLIAAQAPAAGAFAEFDFFELSQP